MEARGIFSTMSKVMRFLRSGCIIWIITEDLRAEDVLALHFMTIALEQIREKAWMLNDMLLQNTQLQRQRIG